MKYFFLLIVCCSLAACGGGSSSGGDDPAPSGSLSGVAFDSAVNGARISVHSLPSGEFLGETSTDADGRFSLDIVASSQPIRIEATGGFYIEEYSGVSVGLSYNRLLAVVNYQAGQTAPVTLSALTTIATGLAEYHMAQGIAVSSAIDQANQSVEGWFGFNPVFVEPVDVTSEAGLIDEAGYQYGLISAGISGLMFDWLLENLRTPEEQATSVFTSINFIQKAYTDISADGVLDGYGNHGYLLFEQTRLTVNAYRNGIARGVLLALGADVLASPDV
ncbi:MAG: carboxypeptidase regulatory-like domain-containing protein [Gammaproteobacteria bacterium]|nr:carboxypeptidase regulatory-like domain-containing protein [Gammaproteobacteria bacterium]